MSGEQYNSSSEILGHRRISILFVILFRVKVTNHMILIIPVKFHYSTAGGGGIWRRYGLFSEIGLKLDLTDFSQFFDFSPKSSHIFPLFDFLWQHVVALIIKFPERTHFSLNTKQFLRYDETNLPLRAHFRRFVQKNSHNKSISRAKKWRILRKFFAIVSVNFFNIL